MSNSYDSSTPGATPPGTFIPSYWGVPIELDERQIAGFATLIEKLCSPVAAEKFKASMLCALEMSKKAKKLNRQAARLKAEAATLGTEAYARRRRAWDECMNAAQAANQGKAGW